MPSYFGSVTLLLNFRSVDGLEIDSNVYFDSMNSLTPHQDNVLSHETDDLLLTRRLQDLRLCH